ncbi:MAG: undecaprenyl-diphosphatase [Thiothrix nivea]|nr:MAG: undecaprenyl-diphosphatase [Thiothrix nivea]
MDLIQVFVLAIVQGITEFLPVSSSAHLILVPVLTDWQDQGLAFDVAVHVGTLSAVIIYFRQDIVRLLSAWGSSLVTFELTPDTKLAWAIGFGTIPVGLTGLFFKDLIEIYLRSPLVIATATIIFGLLLWAADRYGERLRNIYEIQWLDVLLIGLSQAFALIPGTSRSGATMTMALFLGFSRDAAARFSFLLSIPVILLAGALLTRDLLESTVPIDWTALLLGTVLSGISAWICIHYFLKFLSQMGMLPFVIYRLVLGAFLLVMFLPLG